MTKYKINKFEAYPIFGITDALFGNYPELELSKDDIEKIEHAWKLFYEMQDILAKAYSKDYGSKKGDRP